jgi:RimJ/RimL family protein N-acetyltransferase
LNLAFYDRRPALREFLDWHSLPNARYVGIFARYPDRTEIAGLAWLWNIKGEPGGRRADVCIVFRKQYWGQDITDGLTIQMINMAFADIDVLYMETPEWNKLAQALARRMGFTWFGPFPKWGTSCDRPTDAMIGYLEKSTWEKARSGS